SERGSVVVHVAVGLVALTAFSSLTVDFGARYIVRRQAQNAADAAAMTGVLARLYDDTTDPPPGGGTAGLAARATLNANLVNGEVPVGTIDWFCPPDVASLGGCARVWVYKDGTNGSTPLPTFFMQLLGVNTQHVKAMAIAQTRVANAADCLRPWMIPD